jgi:cellulose synthase/poly-beta-1,6-N-acetylglucosamine synthase-like glycosyltransferase
MRILFWLSLFIIAYHFFIYPLSLWLIAKFKYRRVKRESFFPSVTLIIPVYNEEKIIAEKIENSLSLDYPKEKLEIIIASDGSTDNSNRIIANYLNRGINFISYEKHMGKSALINKTVPKARGEIVVLSDASGMLNKEAIKEVVKNFSDPQVGCVYGVYHIWQGSNYDKFEKRYLNFDFYLKKLESKIYTTLGASGSLYAIRKDLFLPLKEDTINDDFFIPAEISLKGLRTIYEDNAHIFDKINTDLKSELRRRIRLTVGGWQQVFRLSRLFNPKRTFLAWQFFSHKFLRIMMPFCFLSLILSSFFCYRIFFWFLIFLSCLSLMFLKSIFLTFLLGNLAGIVGTYKFFFKRGRLIW